MKKYKYNLRTFALMGLSCTLNHSVMAMTHDVEAPSAHKVAVTATPYMDWTQQRNGRTFLPRWTQKYRGDLVHAGVIYYIHGELTVDSETHPGPPPNLAEWGLSSPRTAKDLELSTPGWPLVAGYRLNSNRPDQESAGTIYVTSIMKYGWPGSDECKAEVTEGFIGWRNCIPLKR